MVGGGSRERGRRGTRTQLVLTSYLGLPMFFNIFMCNIEKHGYKATSTIGNLPYGGKLWRALKNGSQLILVKLKF